MPGHTAPLDWSPETEEGYEVARSYLKERFAAWCTGNGTKLEAASAEAPIHYKWGYLDGHLTRWTCDDLDRVYLELHPAKVIAEDEELGPILTEAKAFMAFLTETGLLDPASDPPDVLLDHLDRIEGRFRQHMGDVSRYSFGKRVLLAATAEGVEPDDEEAVRSFMRSFNARPRAEREALLGSQPRAGRKATGRFTPPGTRPRPKKSSASRRRRTR